MIKFVKTFRRDEDGAVTVEWVVLTAAVVGLAFLSYSVIEDSNDAVLTASGEAVLTAQDYLNN
ncbi:Flp family type IVb pilin [Marivita geojedonensis]|uniref:Pilus assembly protein n=1 Tax=Marivita geojedonensis TaxID=1123756 RepID=A0A1X4NIU8_9RHOB|nr:hypothetical protein [Marivita geojedonensis]OSQ48999.1 hypothetical protein MGEO_14225 [Marivita geojedonensis]